MKNTPKRKKRKHRKKKPLHRLGFFLQNHKKTKMEIFAFCVITFVPIKIQTFSAPQNNCLNLSFEKDIKIVGKKPATNQMLQMVIKQTFVSRKFWATGSSFNRNRSN